MEPAVARRLCELNSGFYRAQAQSFSATRRSPWPGWRRCLGWVPKEGELSVLDVACGNLRFASFLAAERPGLAVSYDAVDGCAELASGYGVPPGWDLRFEELDVVGSLLEEGSGVEPAVPGRGPWASRAGGHGLVVCFGFLHHVPTVEARHRLMRLLVGSLAPGGVCCVSLWGFMDDARLARQAREATSRGLAELGLSPAGLDAGDWLLGWQGLPHTYRYCHSFSAEEASDLSCEASDLASEEARFLADGRSGRLDSYLVLRRRDVG